MNIFKLISGRTGEPMAMAKVRGPLDTRAARYNEDPTTQPDRDAGAWNTAYHVICEAQAIPNESIPRHAKRSTWPQISDAEFDELIIGRKSWGARMDAARLVLTQGYSSYDAAKLGGIHHSGVTQLARELLRRRLLT